MKRSSSHRIIFLLPALALLAILSFQCSSTTQPGVTLSDQPFRQQIKPAFAHLDIPSDRFEIQAGETSVIRTRTGTKITIPANSLVDERGKPIKGKAEISYREFHDAADIILSGLPMAYDSAGQIYNFQTAGMMEIQASQKGKPVFIRDGKQVEVSMASFVNEPDYNLYFLEPENNTWEYLSRPALAENEEKKAELAALAKEPLPQRPTLPQTAGKDQPVFAFEVDYSQFPQLAGFEGIQWVFAGTDPGKDPKNNPEALATVWDHMDLKSSSKKGIYELTLRTRTRSFTTEVAPVIEGKNRKKAQKQLDKAIAEYEVYLEKRRKREEMLAMQAGMMRSFAISDFGTYNCDRYARRPEVVRVKATFEFPGIEEEFRPSLVFLVTADSRSVVPYSTQPGSFIFFDPTEANLLVAVTGKDRIAVVPRDRFPNAPALRGQNLTFRMESSDQAISSAEDLRQAMGI